MKRGSIAVVSAALLASGCALNIVKLAQEYSDAPPTIVPVKIERSYIKTVGVQLHPTAPDRAYVVARSGVADEAGYVGPTEWMSRVDEVRGAYEKALLSVIEHGGKKCSVTKAFPYPEWYSIDFVYTCSATESISALH